MKHKVNIIWISFVFVFTLIGVTSFLTYQGIQLSQEKPVKEEIVAGLEKTKMTKRETKDYYYYEIEDYERDLTYSWQFEKDKTQNISVEDSLRITEDLRLSLDGTGAGASEIEEKVNQRKLIISFDYHGALPLKTTVKINVSNRFRNGEHLYLYYYNPENDTIEYITHDVEVKNGYVEFQIEHCSDYFLTAAIVNDAVNNPKSVNFIIIGLIVVVFILIAVTLIQSKNK